MSRIYKIRGIHRAIRDKSTGRKLSSGPMVSVESATQLIRENLPDFGETFVSIDDQLPQTTSEKILSDRDYPPFHRVMMDGIAVNFNQWIEGKRVFKITGISPAGEPAKEMTDFSCAYEVMTGAPLPVGADLVIPYEHLKISDGVATITEELPRKHMENVHLMSSDIGKDEIILSQNTVLNGPHWGIAASVGKTKIRVKRKPSVNIISTGDELVDASEVPLDHQIRRSNAYAIRASLLQHGYSEIKLSHLPDVEEEIEKHLRENINQFDLMIYSGGVSKGKFDYLPEIWKRSGVREIFHGVSQRPGKPLWFGVHAESKTVIMGLPGNPVSSLVCLHRYFLNTRQTYVVQTKEITFKNNLTYFVPVKLESGDDGRLLAHPLPVQNSGEFAGLAGSDGFIELPKDKTIFSPGEVYLYYPWRGNL